MPTNSAHASCQGTTGMLPPDFPIFYVNVYAVRIIKHASLVEGHIKLVQA